MTGLNEGDVARMIARWAACLAAAAVLLAACDVGEGPETPPPLSPVPGPSEIQVIGTIVGQSVVDSVTDYELADGRVIRVDLASKRRVALPGGSPAILVLGRDDRGEWAVEIGHQDGTPEGCHVLNKLGYDLGDSIAIGGVRWRKSPGFHSAVRVPPLGQAYDQGIRFCLDENALVTEILAE
jgi:hypothetical protein